MNALEETARESPSVEATPPKPCNASRGQIGTIAGAVARTLGYDPTRGRDVLVVIGGIGGDIEYHHWDGAERAEPLPTLDVRGRGDFTVSLSKLAGAERNSFSAAHELGHYVLHYWRAGRNDRMTATRSGKPERVEWEANWFAGAFLMPAAEFQTVHRQWKGDLGLVAVHFNVSEAAAAVRARVLGITPPPGCQP